MTLIGAADVETGGFASMAHDVSIINGYVPIRKLGIVERLSENLRVPDSECLRAPLFKK